MTLLAWNNKYSVNIKEIDQQHQKLVELINNLHDRMKEGKGKESLGLILQELASYTFYHFKTEENLFTKYGYPDAKEHIEEHHILLRQVKSIQEEMNKGKSVLTVDVMEFLKEWLTSHIQISDKSYTAFLNSKGVK